MDRWCNICEDYLADMPAEMRLLVDGVCVRCWIESVPHVHASNEIPPALLPLLPLSVRYDQEVPRV